MSRTIFDPGNNFESYVKPETPFQLYTEWRNKESGFSFYDVAERKQLGVIEKVGGLFILDTFYQVKFDNPNAERREIFSNYFYPGSTVKVIEKLPNGSYETVFEGKNGDDLKAIKKLNDLKTFIHIVAIAYGDKVINKKLCKVQLGGAALGSFIESLGNKSLSELPLSKFSSILKEFPVVRNSQTMRVVSVPLFTFHPANESLLKDLELFRESYVEWLDYYVLGNRKKADQQGGDSGTNDEEGPISDINDDDLPF